MKKLLKISALALAMTALLFSCANPTNTNGGANNSNTPNVAPDGNTNPDTPSADIVKPTDVKKPAGYNPSANATAVADTETGLPALMAVVQEVNGISSTILTDVPQEDYTKTGGTEENPIWTITPKEYKLKNNSGTLVIRKYSFGGTEPVNQDYTINITDFAKYIVEEPSLNVKAFKQKVEATSTPTGAAPITTGTQSVAALFDTGTSNGILVYDLTLSETVPSFTKVEFYNLDGTESYKYTDADLETLNETLANM